MNDELKIFAAFGTNLIGGGGELTHDEYDNNNDHYKRDVGLIVPATAGTQPARRHTVLLTDCRSTSQRWTARERGRKMQRTQSST